MAEVSGLTIGVIALASLFSTCVDLFERFELGLNHRDDYELGCTKLCLLKARLRGCRERLSDDSAGSEDGRGKQHEDQLAISRSLLGIKQLFEDAALLEDKYRPSPEKAGSHDFLLSTPKSIPRHKRLTRVFVFSSHPSQTSIRKRTTWAVHDKAKLDTFLSDLDFLIRNLESVMPSASAVEALPTLSDLFKNTTIGKLDVSQSLTILSSPAGKNSTDNGAKNNTNNTNGASANGSQYSGEVNAKGFSSVQQGDIGFSTSHVYTSNVSTTENASVQQGNRSSDFELERLKMNASLQVQLERLRRNGS